MKIQCDVCSQKEASVFCTADEAALCDVCDHRVHHANKLASKHHRLSLVQPSSSHGPLCDICQEKRALLFCQEDRAILCRECDISLHTANEYTQKHNRFLLTGIKLSPKLCDHKVSKISNDGSDTTVPDFNTVKNSTSTTISFATNIKTNSAVNSGTSTASNISDYLIETLPGWHFDDFILDPASTTAPPFGSSKTGNNNSGFGMDEDLSAFFDVEEYEKNFTSYSTQSQNLWVPQAPLAATIDHQPSIFRSVGLVHGTKQQETSVNINNGNKSGRKFIRNDAFTVPQIISSSVPSNKRSRPFW
ncbi:hypothetical protein vseg_009548 [Gypsophila vaccaria]